MICESTIMSTTLVLPDQLQVVFRSHHRTVACPLADRGGLEIDNLYH